MLMMSEESQSIHTCTRPLGRYLKTKTVTRDEGGHYIIIMGSIQKENVTIVNIYAPNSGVPKI